MIAIRKSWLLVATCTALIACGSAANFADATGFDGAGTAVTDGGKESTPQNSGEDAGTGTAATTASGIILVHASRNLPAFRICTQTHASSLPLPYDKLMPNSNLVGVDVGTAVHIDSLSSPAASGATVTIDAGTTDSGTTANDAGDGEGGTDGGVADSGTQGVDAGPPPSEAIYVIDEEITRQFYPPGGDPSTEPNCGVLTQVLLQNGFAGNGIYTVVNASDSEPVSVLNDDLGVSLLVLEGCLPDSTLDAASCGAGYNATTGNLTYRIVPDLTPGAAVLAADDGGAGFSFQAMQLSPRVDSQLTNKQIVSLTFGPLAAPSSGESLSDPLTIDTLVPGAGPLVVPFAPQSLADYDSYGFTLVAGATTLSQSLATIQSQSSPTDLPQSFYLLPSNFIVLIVGDSQVAATSNGPGASLHLLAVPVRDPSTLEDAGTPITTADGG